MKAGGRHSSTRICTRLHTLAGVYTHVFSLTLSYTFLHAFTAGARVLGVSMIALPKGVLLRVSPASCRALVAWVRGRWLHL